MGLVEEGQEIMAEGEKKEDAAADLALTERRSVSSTMRSRLTRRRRTSPSNYATAPSSHCCRSRWLKKRIRISYLTKSPDR
jgi:hypothetical protein